MEIEKSQALWNTMYGLHWDYLETEENSTELLLKKDKLKGCIQEFLEITLPDRKFFLPQTKEVLRGSVQKLIHFDAYEASIAFDAIAQYANNLLTKPWRTEYKVIKTHSGFYQHKIKSQLVDVDELFIAMGYVKSQNQTLLFDGPICPDQLANVSRDCMIACEECLMMHRLYYSLLDNKMNVSWAEVYKFRESYFGDEHQSLAGMQQKRHKDKAVASDHFINQVPAQRCNCNVVTTMHNPHQYQPCQYNYQTIGNNECLNHHLPMNHVNCYQPHYDHISHLPHSRSMDQYTTDHVPISHGLFRHSLDHTITNDTVDGHSRNYKPFIPYNHSMYPPQAAVASNFYNNHINHYDASLSAPSNRPTNANFSTSRISPRNYDHQPVKYDDHTSAMNFYTTSRNCDEDLIKFEDNQKITSKSADRQYAHSDLSYEYNNAQYTDQLRKADSQLNRPGQSYSYANTLKLNQHFDSKPTMLEQKMREMELSNGGLKPSKDVRDIDKSLDRRELRGNEQRRVKNSQILASYEIDDQNSRDSRASDFDSTDYTYDEDNAKASRNKDGQGSMEEWSYVYNGIKKNSQSNGNAFHDAFNGHDKPNDMKNVKKSKESKSEVSVTKSVMKEAKTKVNKIRPSNIHIDEHDLHKNSVKKPQKNGRSVNKSPVIVNEWNCEHCTFLNTGTANICSMCSKSKNFKDKPASKSTPTSV